MTTEHLTATKCDRCDNTMNVVVGIEDPTKELALRCLKSLRKTDAAMKASE